TVQPASWTDQGYPFLSGRAAYRTTFTVDGGSAGARLFLEPAVVDDVVEVVVNDQSAGVRLWPPYGIEITDLVQPGENRLELRVDWAERHARSREAVVALSGSCVVYAAPADATAPDGLRAFVLRPGEGVVLDRGVWHGAPLALDAGARALVVLRRGTGATDTE